MYRKVLIVFGAILGLVISIIGIAYAAPQVTRMRSIEPELDVTYLFGTSTLRWLGIISQYASSTEVFTRTLGIATGTPGTALGVTGTGVFSEAVYARNFVATSTSQASVFPLANIGVLTIDDLAEGDLHVAGDVYVNGGDFNLGTGSATTTISGNGTGIGIATSAPGSMLAVKGPGLFNSTTTIEGGGLIVDGGIFSTSTLGFYTASAAAPRLQIKANGNVGIGRTDPTNLLDIASTYTLTDYKLGVRDTAAQAAGVGGGITLYGLATDAGGYGRMGGIKGVKENSTSANYLAALTFLTPTGSGNDALTERMRIASDGSVGIGTAVPSNKLHVLGTDGTASEIRVESTDTDSDAFFVSDNDANVWTFGIDGDTSDAFILSNAFGLGTPKLTVLTGGNVGIGTTSPAALLHLHSTSGSVVRLERNDTILATDEVLGALEFYSNDLSTFNTDVRAKVQSIGENASGDNVGLSFFTSQHVGAPLVLSEVVRISGAGNVGIGSTSPSYKLSLEGGNFFHKASTSPSVVGSVVDATNINSPRAGIKCQGSYCYVTDGASNESLTVVNVSSSTAPQVTGTVSTGVASDPLGLDVQGNYAYVTAISTDSLVIIDISNPTTPKVISTLASATQLDGANRISVMGRYAYITAQSDDMFTIVDISDPVNPRVVSTLTSASLLDLAWGVAVQGRYAYVTGTYSGSLSVIDISRPDAPVIVGSLTDATNLNNAKDVVVAGRYAYTVASTTSTFTIIDVSNPP